LLHVTKYLIEREFHLVVEIPESGVCFEGVPIDRLVGIESDFGI
jgi:hypothetical protein